MRRGLLIVLIVWLGASIVSAQQVVTPWKLVIGTDARTIASNGAGTPATLTLAPLTSHVSITCNDPDGCAITLSETNQPGATIGGTTASMTVDIVNVSTNAVTFATSAGVQQLQSSASLGQWGVIAFDYETDRWVERFRAAGGSGTVTTTGSPASGNLAKFSGAATITNADLTGDVTTTGTVATTIANDAVSNAKLRNSGPLSVIGRSANSTGDPADISATAASDQVLRESGSVLGFGTVATGGIANNAITYAKLQDVTSAGRLLGRGSSAGSGDPEEISLGSGLSMSGTTLSATGGGGSGGTTLPSTCDGRLTTESGVPVSTSDRTAQSTLYYTPAINGIATTNGNCTLYNGSTLINVTFTQLSLALSGLTSGKNYDAFLDYNSGSLQIVLSAAWTDDTTRADALGQQSGMLIKSGTPAYRWLGTIRTTGTTTTEDSAAKRFVWNAFNQSPRQMKNATETADTWNYSTASFRQANANAANQLDYVTGVSSAFIEATAMSLVLGSGANQLASTGIGVDSTTTNSGTFLGGNAETAATNVLIAVYKGSPGLGRHTLAWLEKGHGTGTQTWHGDAGAPTFYQYGIVGTIWN